MGVVLLGALVALGVPACSGGGGGGSSAPAGPQPKGEFVAWQSLGGGAATRAQVVANFDGLPGNDVFEVNYGEQNRLLVNDNAGELTDATNLSLVAGVTTGLPAANDLSRCAAAVDVDGDGDIDIVVGNNGFNTLLLNNGAGTFTDGTDPGQKKSTGLPQSVDDTWAIAAFDVDGDGDQDLVIGNTGQNQLLLNDGKGEFFVGTDLVGTLTTGLPANSDATRALAVADLDADSDMDIVVANEGGAQDRILINSNGAGEFVDNTFSATQGLPLLADNSRGVVVSNFDGTTGPDLLFVGEGQPRLLLNNGGGFFTDASTDWAREVAGQTDSWRGLYVVDANNLFAVGENGTIRYSGGAGGWGSQTSNVTADLRGVHGLGAGNIYAVGDLGTIINGNGSTWSSPQTNAAQPNASATPPYAGDNLNGIHIVASGAGGNEYFAVGDRAMILKSTNGSSWTQVTGSDNPVYTAPVASPPTGPMGPNLHGVAGFTGATDTVYYAVGDNGTILRKADGATAWTQQTSNTTRNLYAIFGTSATTLWAVGEGGTILTTTNSGTTWTPRPSGSNRDLLAVWTPNGTDVWAVGRAGTVLISSDNGVTWAPDQVGTDADFYAVGGTSPTNIWVHGLVGFIGRDTGATSTTQLPSVFLDAWGAVTFDVNGDFLDDVIIANNGPNYVLLNNAGAIPGNFSDGSATVLTTRPSNDSRGVSTALIDGGGSSDLLWSNTGQNRLDLNGGSGTFADGTDTAQSTTTGLPVYFDGRDAAVGDVTGDGRHDIVVAVSGGRNRLFVRAGFGFLDQTSTRMPNLTAASEGVTLVDVDGDSDLDLVVANRGSQDRIYQNDGSGNFTDITNPGVNFPADSANSTDVSVGDVDNQNGPDLVIATDGGQNRLYLNDGSGNFTDASGQLPTDADPSQDVALADIDGDGDLDLITANAGAWTARTPTFSENLNGVSAVASNDIWAVGDSGRVAHWNGTTWAATTEAAANGKNLRAVFAISAMDVVAVGDDATIIRYNGTNWTAESAPGGLGTGDHLQAVHGTGAGDLHAVGVNGLVIRNTGSGWTQITPNPTAANLTGVFAHSNLLAVAVGQTTPPLALVWNGTFWATLNPGGSPVLNGVTGVGGTDAYAVGNGGTILRYRGKGWSTVASATSVALNGIAANSVGGLLAVGASGTAVRDTGKGFALEATGISAALNSVTFAGTADAVAVGASGNIVRWTGAQNRIATNNGSGTFTDQTSTALPVDTDVSMDVALADVDGDNDLDLFFANSRGQNRLYINNGGVNFADGTDLLQTASTGLEPDFDDSRAGMFVVAKGNNFDILVANFEQQNRLHLNQGGGEFLDSTDESGANPYGLIPDRSPTHAVKLGNFDGNGWLDAVFVNSGTVVVLLHR